MCVCSLYGGGWRLIVCVLHCLHSCVCSEMNCLLTDRAIPNSVSNDAFLPGGGSVV